MFIIFFNDTLNLGKLKKMKHNASETITCRHVMNMTLPPLTKTNKI